MDDRAETPIERRRRHYREGISFLGLGLLGLLSQWGQWELGLGPSWLEGIAAVALPLIVAAFFVVGVVDLVRARRTKV